MEHRSYKVKKRLALTSLIDIIFLLLLFLMLTSTFSKFSEIELGVATTAAKNKVSEKILFSKTKKCHLNCNIFKNYIFFLYFPLILQIHLFYVAFLPVN